MTQQAKKPASLESGHKQPKSFQDQEIDRMLVKGEEVILRARLHNAIYWKSIAVLIIALLMFFIASPIGVMLFVVGALMLCVAILTQHFLLLAVTNKRVLARYGLLQMDVVDIRLSKIESIDLERMLPGHIFGYANVVVMGTGNRMIRVSYIGNAEEFRRYYNEMVLAEEGNEEVEAEIRQAKSDDEQAKAAADRKKSKKV
ncbi:MAG: PH domain-containing protein [Alphaproteobacteria bacterium]